MGKLKKKILSLFCAATACISGGKPKDTKALDLGTVAACTIGAVATTGLIGYGIYKYSSWENELNNRRELLSMASSCTKDICEYLLNKLPNNKFCNKLFKSLCNCKTKPEAVVIANSLSPNSSMSLGDLQNVYDAFVLDNSGNYCDKLRITIETEKARIERKEARRIQRESNRIAEHDLLLRLNELRHGYSSAAYYWYDGVQYYYDGYGWVMVESPISSQSPPGYYQYGDATYYWNGYAWVL